MSLANLQPRSHPIVIPSHPVNEKSTWSQKSEKLLPPTTNVTTSVDNNGRSHLEELDVYLSSVSNFNCLAGMESFTSHTNTRN